MATQVVIDPNNSNKKETVEVTFSETPKQKLLPPPFIIYSETNEECIIDDDEPGAIDKSESEATGAKKSRRRNRRNRHKNKKGLREELGNMDSLVLPDGVKLVEEGTYIGFQCTYCNCVMSSLKTVEEHTEGNPHKQKLRSKAAKGEKVVVDTGVQKQSTPPPVPKDDVSSSDTLPSAAPPVPDSENSASLSNSSLSKFLLKTKEPIVGLDHIIEVQLPDTPPTYRCNLCILDCNSDGIKEHVVGTRHRLSYLRIMDTQKVAQMLALNLKKPERNKRTVKHAEELQALYGSGTIQVTNTPLPPITVAIETETKASAQPQAAVQPGNNPPITIWTEPIADKFGNDAYNPVGMALEPQYINQNFAQGTAQKRPSEGGYPPWKRQSMGRGFQERRRYNSRWQQGNYFDRRQSAYRERESNYPDQYQEGRAVNREQYGNKQYEKTDQPIEKEPNREQDMSKSHAQTDHHIDREPNKEQDENKLHERNDQLVDREPNREHHSNKPFERRNEHVDRQSNREQHGNKPFERRNEHVDRQSNREQYGNKPFERRNEHVDRQSNREQYGNKPFERRNEHVDRQSNREQYGNKPFERRDQRSDRGPNRERAESWRSYSDNRRDQSTPIRPQSDPHMTSPSPSKQEQQPMMENPPNNEDLKNNAGKPMEQTGYESVNMQGPVPPPPIPDMNYPPNYQDTDNQSNMRGRGRGGRFNTRNRGSSFSRSATNRFPTSRFESSASSGFNRFGDFGRSLSFRSMLSDPLSNERDRLKMKYPGLRLGR